MLTYSISVLPKLQLKNVPVFLSKLQFIGVTRTNLKEKKPDNGNGNGTKGSVEHPGSANLSRTKRSEASEVIGSVKQRMRMRNPGGPVCAVLRGQARQRRSESEGFSLTMTRVSIVRGNHEVALPIEV